MLDVEAWPLTSILKQKQNDLQPKSQAHQITKDVQIVGELIFLKALLIVYLELFWQRSMIYCLFLARYAHTHFLLLPKNNKIITFYSAMLIK